MGEERDEKAVDGEKARRKQTERVRKRKSAGGSNAMKE
jgi:hypothetical protein